MKTCKTRNSSIICPENFNPITVRVCISYTLREQKQHGYLLLNLSHDTDDQIHFLTNNVSVIVSNYLYN